MKVSIEETRDLCKCILSSQGLTDEEATIIVEDYLDAEMRGKPSHGIGSFSVHPTWSFPFKLRDSA